MDTLLGGGICGHLGLVLPFHVYNTIVPHQASTNAWIDPHYPGLQPAFPLNATEDQIAPIKARHAEQMRLWKLSNNVNAALRKQILACVDNIYLRALKQAHTGYSNLKVRDIVMYLFAHYSKITPQSLLANNERFRQDWDPSSPFKLLIDQIKSAQEFARDGNQPYSGWQILTTAYNLVYKTGLYFEDCKT